VTKSKRIRGKATRTMKKAKKGDAARGRREERKNEMRRNELSDEAPKRPF